MSSQDARCLGHYYKYVSAKTWEERKYFYGRIQQIRTPMARLFCTEVALELSASAVSDRVRQDYAEQCLEMAAITKQMSSLEAPQNKTRLRATALIPNIPALLTLKTFQDSPNFSQLHKAYEVHRSDISELYSAITSDPRLDYEKRRTAEGRIAESIVLLLLQHYALDKIGDKYWTPLPAVGIEDATISRDAEFQPTWDVSVYTGLPKPNPSPAYKIQIKLRKNSNNNVAYENGISMLYLQDDLTLPDERNNSGEPFVDTYTLMEEISPRNDGLYEERRDARTDLILDIIDS